MQSDSGIGLEVLSVKCGQHPNVVLASLRGTNNTICFIDHLDEVSSAEVHRLNSLNLLTYYDYLVK